MLSHSKTFPPKVDRRHLRRTFVPSGPIDRALWNDTIASLGELGADPGLRRAMKRAAAHIRSAHCGASLAASTAGSPPGDRLRENLAHLRGAIETTLGPLIPRDRPCALVDFPSYTNVGDSAIWVGERAVLDDLGVDVAYAADRISFRRRTLERRIGRGPILITGGGNFGDLWPAWQEFREELVTAFPRNRNRPAPPVDPFRGGRESRSAPAPRCRDIRTFVVLVRDVASLKTAREDLCVEASLCPDMAFGLPPMSRPGPPETRDPLARARGFAKAPPSAAWARPRDRRLARRARERAPVGQSPARPPGAALIPRRRTLGDQGTRNDV